MAMIALVACKQRSQLPIGEACTADKECDNGLYCVEGLGQGKKCLKACGASRVGEMYADEDSTCPAGWSCSATMVQMYKDKDGVEKRAYLGLADRPMCVPEGWTPDREPPAK